MAYDRAQFERNYKRAKRAGWHTRIETEADKRAVAEGCVFVEQAGQRVVDFLSTFCRHTKGRWAGQPFVPLEWQRERLIMPLYGWLRPEIATRGDGTQFNPRRFRRVQCWVPKKNGKSTLASGLGLYHLTADGEAGAEIYSAASDRQQAAIVFNEAANMAEKDQELSAHLEIVRSTKRIVYREALAYWQVLSADAFRAEGFNSSCTIFDELHVQKTRVLWDALEYAGTSRDQPLLLVISTSGTNRETIGYEQFQLAKAIIDGTSDDPTVLAVVYAADDADDWTDPAVWRKNNPSFGITIKESDMAAECEQAQRSPAAESNFKQKRLNLWTTSELKAINESDWNACKRNVHIEDYIGRRCYTGMDLATTTDIAALYYLFPEEDKTVTIFPYFFCPLVGAAERAQRDIAPYTRWISEGHMIGIKGRVIDFAYIRQRLLDDRDRFQFVKCGYDPWNASESALELQGAGFEMVLIRQGYGSMSEPSKRFEKMILSNQMHHDGNPVMNWMMGNLMWQVDAKDNRYPTKEKDSQKVDGPVAAIMGLAVYMLDEEPPKSVYETEDLLVL